jgi:hypothetical protein
MEISIDHDIISQLTPFQPITMEISQLTDDVMNAFFI